MDKAIIVMYLLFIKWNYDIQFISRVDQEMKIIIDLSFIFVPKSIYYYFYRFILVVQLLIFSKNRINSKKSERKKTITFFQNKKRWVRIIRFQWNAIKIKNIKEWNTLDNCAAGAVKLKSADALHLRKSSIHSSVKCDGVCINIYIRKCDLSFLFTNAVELMLHYKWNKSIRTEHLESPKIIFFVSSTTSKT